MASTILFAAVSQGLLRFSEYRERKDPLNKYKHVGTYAASDIEPTLGGQGIINKIQIQIGAKNDASFPISVILESAETEVEGLTPPRSRFPKPPIVVGPGATIRHVDEPINMNKRPCQNLMGNMQFVIRYGLPNKERYRLEIREKLQIFMEPNGKGGPTLQS